MAIAVEPLRETPDNRISGFSFGAEPTTEGVDVQEGYAMSGNRYCAAVQYVPLSYESEFPLPSEIFQDPSARIFIFLEPVFFDDRENFTLQYKQSIYEVSRLPSGKLSLNGYEFEARMVKPTKHS